MLPLINGKSFLSCSEADLQVLLDNSDFREDEYLDYKATFSFLEMPKGKERDAKKTEFKSDVCSFANADGGYLIFGISDKNGCASAIEGIDVPNYDTDRFELDRRNDLNGIQPKVPPLQFSFIQLESGKYIVVILIKHDSFAPYIHLENEKNYRIYKRYGNGKKTMSYSEIRQMFNQSLSLDEAIMDYLYKRIEHYRKLDKSFGERFIHLCFIPETFRDRYYSQNMFVLERSGKAKFSEIFSPFGCYASSIPCVDGIRYIPYRDKDAEGYVRNNGIVEACLSLDEDIRINESKYPEGFLPWVRLWDQIKAVCFNYIKVFNNINIGERVFLCLAIVGCRNVLTNDEFFVRNYVGRIDRDEVICEPVELLRINNEFEVGNVLKKLQIAFLLSIGVKYDKTLQKLIEDVYGVK